MAEEAERFAQRAAKQIGVPVEMVDERLTSWEAERLLEEKFGRVSHSATTRGASPPGASAEPSGAASVDAVAAAVILQEYLERRRGAERDE
jgi:putative holliday junction resolvase